MLTSSPAVVPLPPPPNPCWQLPLLAAMPDPLPQIAVLGLPWEYTSADVRALLEAAAEAEGRSAADAGVEYVEVAYRDDGKSEVGRPAYNTVWSNDLVKHGQL